MESPSEDSACNDDPSPFEGPFFDRAEEIDAHKNHLPHWQQGDVWVFVTWRLNDSLPKWRVNRWKEEREIWLKSNPRPWDARMEIEHHKRFSGLMDKWLDQGGGSCVLKDPRASSIVAATLRHFDGHRYELASFVVMPNHVHVLFRPFEEGALASVLKSWKGFSAKTINKQIGRTGQLWQPDYWDRLIRSSRHFEGCLKYIRMNPGKALLHAGQFLLFENPKWEGKETVGKEP